MQHEKAEAKWKNWENVFAAYQAPLGYEIDGTWLIAHDQVSVPIDVQCRSAVMDLER